MADKQQCLAWGGQLAEDPLDVGPKPDVEHAIRLVEHHVNDIAQIERAALDVVEHAAGGADDQVDSPRERANLFFDRLAAEYAADLRRQTPSPASESRRRSAASARGSVPGRSPEDLARRASSISINGIPNAAVFPVPVLAWPMTSRPSRASGMKAAWMGVGVR